MSDKTYYNISKEGIEWVLETSSGRSSLNPSPEGLDVHALVLATFYSNKGRTFPELKRYFRQWMPKIPTTDERVRTALRNALDAGYVNIVEDD